MSGISKYLLTFVTGLIVVSLNSCASSAKRGDSASLLQPNANPVAMVASAPQNSGSNNSNSIQTVQKPATPRLSDRGRNLLASTVLTHKISVIIYTSDDRCQALIPERVSVSAEHAGLAAVGKIIERESTADLSLAGYRVSVDQNSGVATVDLRTATDSKWHLTSLSSCEQFALFGSLRRTLTGNAQWKIKDVRFTERGKEISL